MIRIMLGDLYCGSLFELLEFDFCVGAGQAGLVGCLWNVTGG